MIISLKKIKKNKIFIYINMPYIELTYDKILNEIEEYIILNRLKLKKRTLKNKKNTSIRIKK